MHGEFFSKRYGWQYALMYIIFEIKQQGLIRKNCFVVGGYILDSIMFKIFSSNILFLLVWLLLLIATQNGLKLMAGDLGDTFHTSQVAEKVWSIAGP